MRMDNGQRLEIKNTILATYNGMCLFFVLTGIISVCCHIPRATGSGNSPAVFVCILGRAKRCFDWIGETVAIVMK